MSKKKLKGKKMKKDEQKEVKRKNVFDKTITTIIVKIYRRIPHWFRKLF